MKDFQVARAGTGLEVTDSSRARALDFQLDVSSPSGLTKLSLEPVGLLQCASKASDS